VVFITNIKNNKMEGASIQATIDDLNQYLQGNVTAEGLIDTLQDTLNFLKDSEGINRNQINDFDLKEYLSENKLLKNKIK
tara:strand:+ start:233 stop:472 length:240 start_codon:yes stop_codon:yes gene_type:complete